MITAPTEPVRTARDRIEVLLRGDVPERVRSRALDEVQQAVDLGVLPLVRARVTLRRLMTGAATCRVDIAVDLGGHLIHGRADDIAPEAALHVAAGRVHLLARALGPAPGPVLDPTP